MNKLEAYQKISTEIDRDWETNTLSPSSIA